MIEDVSGCAASDQSRTRAAIMESLAAPREGIAQLLIMLAKMITHMNTYVLSGIGDFITSWRTTTARKNALQHAPRRAMPEEILSHVEETWRLNVEAPNAVILSFCTLMRLIGVGTFSGSRTKLRIVMQTGCWTMAILDLERSGKRLISIKNYRKHVASCCLSMVPKGRADWVQLHGYNGYVTKLDLLRQSLMVDVC